MANYYNIFTKYENALYERGDSNYYSVSIKNLDCTALADPSTVSISIYNPCGDSLISTVSMTKYSTGIYYYVYDIAADAPYGEYEIIITAKETTNNTTTLYRDRFYILPWNISYDVRKLAGLIGNKSISGHDLALIIWESFLEASNETLTYHKNEMPKCNPDTGELFNGSNVTFSTKCSPLADYNFDGSVTGYGEESCATDIEGYWKDEDGNCERIKITVKEPECGLIEITQLDDSPIPSNAQWVHLYYWTEWDTFDKELFKKATAYLAAHKCIIRFRELTKATMADLQSNKTVVLDERNRMEKEYKKVLNKIRKPPIGGAMFNE